MFDEALTSESSEEYVPDRKRGILTNADRLFLRRSEDEREDEYTRPLRYERRQKIKERTANAVLDISLLAKFGDDELYLHAFTDEKTPEGLIEKTDPMRTRRALSKFTLFLARAQLAEKLQTSEGTEIPPESANVRLALRPVLDEIESGIEHWLNQERGMTADFEIPLNVENVRTIEQVKEELELRRTPVTGKERLETAALLDRAGVEMDEILSLLGEDVPEDAETYEDYSPEELAELPTEKLSRLLADGVLSVTQHSAAIDAKLERGKN
jgi:hypothetical protein